MARCLSEKIRVSYVVVNSVIDLKLTCEAMPNKTEDLVELVWFLTQQPPSA